MTGKVLMVAGAALGALAGFFVLRAVFPVKLQTEKLELNVSRRTVDDNVVGADRV